MAENPALLKEARERLAILRAELQNRENGNYRERLAIPLLQNQIMEWERREAELGGFAPAPSPQYTQTPGTPYTGPSTLRPGENPGSPRAYEVPAPTPGTMEDDPGVTGVGGSDWEDLGSGGWESPSGFEQIETPTWGTDEDVGGAGAASSQGWESAASSSSAQEDALSEDFATKAEARAKAAFEATYTEIRDAFGVGENASASDWNAYLKAQVDAAVNARDPGSLITRYTQFLTEQTLSTPLSLFEVAFIVHLNVAKTPQVGTLKIITDAIPDGELNDFATIALVVAGYVQTSSGISKSVEDKLVKLGLATPDDRIKLVISSGALRTLIRMNNTMKYEIRNAALDVFRALADVELQNGQVMKSKNARKFTGRRRLDGPVKFLIRNDDTDTTIPVGAYAEFSSSFMPGWPHPSAPATRGKKKRRSSGQGVQKRAKKRLGEAGAALDEATDLREYLAGVLKYIRDSLGEDNEDYKRLLQRLDAYSERHTKMEESILYLQQSYVELQSKNEKIEAELETANTSLREALASLEKALEAGDGGTGVALKTLEAAEKRAEEAEKELEKCNAKLEELTEQLAEAFAEIKRLKESGAALQVEFNRCKRAYADLRGAYDRSQYGHDNEIAALKKRVAELQGGQDAWKHRLLDAVISGSMDKFREALFYMPYKYKLDEVTELLKLGTKRTIFEADDRGRFLFLHPILTGINIKKVFNAMNEAVRRFVISNTAIRSKIVRRDIKEMNDAARQAYARGLLESAGVPQSMINQQAYLNTSIRGRIDAQIHLPSLVEGRISAKQIKQYEPVYFTNGEVDFANLFKIARDRKYKDGAKVMAAYLASDKFSEKHLARIGILQVSESDWLKTFGTKLKKVDQIATSLLGAAVLGRNWDVVNLLAEKGANERVPTTDRKTKPPTASPVLIAMWVGRSEKLSDIMYKYSEFKKMLR